MRGLLVYAVLLLLWWNVAVGEGVTMRWAVFGMAGSGKSTFIKNACNANIDSVSSDGDGTLGIKTHKCNIKYNNKYINEHYNEYNNIVFIDTPGFGTRLFPNPGQYLNVESDGVILLVSNRLFTQHYDFVNTFDLLYPRKLLVVVRSQTDIFPVPNEQEYVKYIMKEFLNVPKFVIVFNKAAPERVFGTLSFAAFAYVDLIDTGFCKGSRDHDLPRIEI